MKLTSSRAIPTIRVKFTPKGRRVARPIPRDRVCWYCTNDQHPRCPWPATCACWTCYATEMQQQAGGSSAEASS